MSWEKKSGGPASWGRSVEGGLRRPDGSPDIAAYGKIAHRERQAAVLSAVKGAARSIRAMPWAVWRVLTRSLGGPGRIRLNAPLRS